MFRCSASEYYFPIANCRLSGVVGFLRADKHEQIEVHTDAHGLDPREVERTFLNWPEDRPRPSVLYTIPTGSNPTGRCTSEARKAEV